MYVEIDGFGELECNAMDAFELLGSLLDSPNVCQDIYALRRILAAFKVAEVGGDLTVILVMGELRMGAVWVLASDLVFDIGQSPDRVKVLHDFVVTGGRFVTVGVFVNV